MKLLTRVRECRPRKSTAADAMRRIRLEAIKGHRDLVRQGLVRWVFYSHECQQHHILIDSDSLEQADAALKGSPLFPFCTSECIPVVTSDAVVSEIRGALGMGSTALAENLVTPAREVDPAGIYWLVRKELPPMDPLSTDEDQNELLVRTVESKANLDPHVEFADLNAVGQMVGYLIGEGTRDQVHAYLRGCALFNDLRCSIDRLMTLDQAQAATEAVLIRGASPAPQWPCGTIVYSRL